MERPISPDSEPTNRSDWVVATVCTEPLVRRSFVAPPRSVNSTEPSGSTARSQGKVRPVLRVVTWIPGAGSAAALTSGATAGATRQAAAARAAQSRRAAGRWATERAESMAGTLRQRRYLGLLSRGPLQRPRVGAMSGDDARSVREIEDGVQRDFTAAMSYGDYLGLDQLLSAQHPRSQPEQHDELLFIIQHQTSELWLKLMLHELRSARSLLTTDELAPALKRLARVKRIQEILTDQWSVLATLTPSEYAEIRPFLATSSGFQSWQYRAVEFLLGNKNADMVKVFDHDEAARSMLAQLLEEPSLYDEFLAYLARRGYAIPAELLERDVTQPYRENDALVDTFAAVYAQPTEHWGVYETCEELVDLEDNFQQWRFRHLQVVTRTIGHKKGTGGSSGVDFLRRALDLTFFPELYTVRTRV